MFGSRILVLAGGVVAGLALAPGAVAAPPDTPATTGHAVARPADACGGTAPIRFDVEASIEHGTLIFKDPGGVTSGPIRPDGTAHLTGTGQSYDVVSQSKNGRILTTKEMHAGCLFDTVMTFPRFPMLMTVSEVVESSAAPRETESVAPESPAIAESPAAGEATPEATGTTDDGGIGWFWGLLLGVGALAAIGGGLLLRGGGRPAVVDGPPVDEDIRKAAATWYGVETPAVADDIAERDWKTLLNLEQQTQDEILAAYRQLLGEVAQGVADYNKQFDTYRTTYSRVLSGSTELQGLMQAWVESQDTLEKADLAFAILTLLVSGVTLGIKGVRMIRSIGTAAEAGTAGAKVATTAAGAAETGSGLANANLKVATALATEAGVDFSKVLAKHGGSMELAVKEVAELVFARRGWHYLSEFPSVMAGGPVDVSEVVSRLITNTRTALGAAAKRGVLTSEAYAGLAAGGAKGPSLASIKKDIEILKEIIAKEPKFLDSLKTAVVDMYEPALKIGKTGTASMTQGMEFELQLARAQGNAVRVAELEAMLAKAKIAADFESTVTVKLLGAGDFEILSKVLEAGGDIAKLQELLGPAQAITMTEIFGKAGLAVGATTQTTMNLFVNGSSTQIYDVADFAKSMGVVGRLEGSSNVVTFAAGEMWHLVTSPFTTTGQWYYTSMALDAQQRFVEEFGNDLQAMATAMQNGTNAIGHIARAIKNARLDDPKSILGGKGAAKLQGVVDDMQKALKAGSDGFRAKHGPEFEERRAHVAQKLATINRVIGQLTALAAKLPQLETWLHQMQVNPDGSQRPVTEGIDPKTLMRMSSAFFYLNGVLGAIAAGK